MLGVVRQGQHSLPWSGRALCLLSPESDRSELLTPGPSSCHKRDVRAPSSHADGPEEAKRPLEPVNRCPVPALSHTEHRILSCVSSHLGGPGARFSLAVASPAPGQRPEDVQASVVCSQQVF